MKRFLDGVLKLNTWMQYLATILLTVIIILTTTDVILRIFRMPIPGTVEIVAICGGALLGLTMPITSWMRGHISVDFLLNGLSRPAKNALNIVTRCVAIGLFLIISWNLIKIGKEFLEGSEVSGTLQIPLYPVSYGLAACFVILCLVLFCDILKILGGSYE